MSAEDIALQPQDHKSGFVVLFGRPNTGKSTLLNAVVGQKIAIVSSKPQTTRDRIAGILNLPNAQIVFLDTPGIHKPRHALGERLVETAIGGLPDSDIRCLVVDCSEGVTPDDQRSASKLKSDNEKVPTLLVINKIDLVTPQTLDMRRSEFERLMPFDGVVELSATERIHIDDFINLLVNLLPEGPQYFPEDMSTDRSTDFLVGERIREATLRLTHQEVPHAVAVKVEDMEPRREGLMYISATIYVERDTQKSIVIGRGGSMLKQIGQESRREIEELIGNKVFLDLRVKVRKKWRWDESMLQRLGFGEG